MIKKVIIDFGHGGKDPGAIGYVTEKDVTMSVGLALKHVLTQNGLEVALTRPDDRYLTLKERYELANKLGGDLFLSIHCNAADNTSGNGTETYYYSDKNKPLAEKINKSVVTTLGTTDRKAQFGQWAVIKHTRMPALLLELAFVSNQKDGQKLKALLGNRDERLRLVNGLANVIKSHKF